MYFKIVIFCFLFLFESNINYCPLENGILKPDLSMFVRGEGERRGVCIVGKQGAEVYTISDGVVRKIGKRTKAIYIENKDLTYIYYFVDANVKQGQHIAAGSIIGHLNEDFLLLRVRKKDKNLNARKYINCFKE